MDKVVFRWFEDNKGGSYCERALAMMPNHNAKRMLEEHELTPSQSAMDLDALIVEFPKPRRVRSLQ